MLMLAEFNYGRIHKVFSNSVSFKRFSSLRDDLCQRYIYNLDVCNIHILQHPLSYDIYE